MDNILLFTPKDKEIIHTNSNQESNILLFTPKKKKYSEIIKPNINQKNGHSLLTKEQAINFYANYLFDISCSSQEDVLKWARDSIYSVQSCGNTFLICFLADKSHKEYIYLTLKTNTPKTIMFSPELENNKFKSYIKEVVDLSFSEADNRFYTWVDLDNPHITLYDRKLFLMPDMFYP